MTFPVLRSIHKGNKGFTLIEVLVVVVLIGLVSTGITASIIQLLKINTRASNHMIAVRQVQQAGKEVSKDTLQAQNVTYREACGFPIILAWTDWDGLENEIVYTLQPMPSSPGLKMLQRTHTINGTPQATAPPVVAEYIDSDCALTSFYPAGDAFTFTVTATVGEQSETRVYEIQPRPGS